MNTFFDDLKPKNLKIETITSKSQKSSLDKEECTRDVILNEITGEIHECDLIDSENISEDIFIPKDSAALKLSNDSDSMSSVGSSSSYYKCPKRKNNDIDNFRKLIKLKEDITLITMEMLKNKSTKYGICLMLKEKLDDCTKQDKKELTTRIFDIIKDY
ncbi:unnamed protein product [Gordionus sp. m RMFG-2023]